MTQSGADPNRLQEFITNGAQSRIRIDQRRQALQTRLRTFLLNNTRGGDVGGFNSVAALTSAMQANEQWLNAVRTALLMADRTYRSGTIHLDDAEMERFIMQQGVVVAEPDYIVAQPTSLLGVPATSGFVDDPVCMVNGNFVEQETDLQFPARSAVLNVRRTYNALACGRRGAFGLGWTSVFDIHLVDNGERIHVLLVDGAEIEFMRDDSGIFRSFGRPQFHIIANSTGWTLREGEDANYVFDANGLLVEHNAGIAAIVVHRSGDGHIDRLSEKKSGRFLEVSWRDDVVESLTSSDGRIVHYLYEDNFLVSVERATGSLRYVQENGRIAEIFDADGIRTVKNVYDEHGRVVEQTSALGRTSVYEYQPNGVTIASDTELSARNAFIHDRHGNLTALVDGSGNALRLRYDGKNRMVAWTDRRGATWDLYWNDADRPVRRTGPLGIEETWQWDASGRLIQHTFPGGERLFTYTGSNRRPSVVMEAGGVVTNFDIDDNDQVIAITDADGVKTALQWDHDGQLRAAIDAFGNMWTAEYAADGELRQWKNPSSATARFERDDAGRVARVQSAAGNQRYEWSAAGRAVAGEDSGYGSWHATYGDKGVLTSIAHGETNSVLFEHDTFGNIAAIVASDGMRYTQKHDALSQLRELADPLGNVWRYSYDAEGTRVAITAPSGAEQRRVLDDLGRTVQDIDAVGRCTRYEWGVDGRLQRFIEPDEHIFTYSYDQAGRLTRIHDEHGFFATYEYTPAGRLAHLTDSVGRDVRYEYDEAGRMIVIDDVADGRLQWTLDVDGCVVAVAGRNGRLLQFDRDEAGRVVGVCNANGLRRQIDLDEAGRPVRVVDGTASTEYAWTARGLLSRATDALGIATTYSYDNAGRLSSRTSTASSETFSYDGAGRLAGVVDAAGVLTELLRNDDTLVVGARVGQENGSRIWRDASGRITGFSAFDADSPSISIVLDAAGRPVGQPTLAELRISQSTAGESVQYNTDGRVARAPDGSTFHHDAGGQLIQWTAPSGESTSYEYDNGGRLVFERSSRSTDVHVEADETGQVRYDYDLRGRLLRRVDILENETTYEYDFAGRRVRETNSDGSATAYFWNDNNRLQRIEYLGSNATSETNIEYDNLGLISSVNDVPVRWDLRFGFPLLVRVGDVEIGNARRTDWMRNAEAVTDPWGVSANTGVRAGYRSELCIDRLVMLGARVYDPTTRAFLSPDPLPNPPGAVCSANPYHYAWNDPVTFIDPSGLRPISQADFDKRVKAYQEGMLDRAWDAVTADPWGYIELGLVVTAGVALCFVPVVGPAIGTGVLLSVAISGGVGLATGTFDPQQVAVAGIIGGAVGALGAAPAAIGVATAGRLTVAAVGAGAGAAGNEAGYIAQTAMDPTKDITMRGSLGAFASGAVTGGLGTLTGPAGQTFANKLSTSPAIVDALGDTGMKIAPKVASTAMSSSVQMYGQWVNGTVSGEGVTKEDLLYGATSGAANELVWNPLARTATGAADPQTLSDVDRIAPPYWSGEHFERVDAPAVVKEGAINSLMDLGNDLLRDQGPEWLKDE